MTTLNPYDKDIDLINKEDKDLYLSAIKQRKGEDIYDLSNDKFESFMTKLARKVQEFALDRDRSFSAEITKSGASVTKIITSCYGEISLKDIATQAKAIWLDSKGDVVTDKNTDRRHMSFQVMANLLTDNAMTQMMSRESEFLVGGGYHDPVLFFKSLVERVKPSCRLSVKALKKDLRNLSLKAFKFVVPDANMHAKTKYQEILTQGQTYDEMVSDLFDMYGTARNQRFCDDMARMEDLYNDGTDMTSEEIMAKAEIKYQNLKSGGKWDTTDPRDAQIVALTTVIKGLVQHNYSTSSQSNNKKTTNKKKATNNRNDGEWLVAPVNGEKEKVIDGRQAQWCATCNNGTGKWVVSHNTDSHDGQFLQKLTVTKAKRSDKDPKPASKKLKLNAELAAAMQTLTG
jgi:hypothetical protein